VLAPGYSNYQLSSEYRTYDITGELRRGANTLGVRLGNGPAYVRRSVSNPAVGRTSPYSWWESQLKGRGVLAAGADSGATTVKLDSVTGYHLGGTINIGTGDGGDDLESRTITAIGTAGADGTGITFTPALDKPHLAGTAVTGSGNNIAASDASAGAAVTPRMIARLEISYAGGKTDVIVSDRSWRTSLGALVTDAWYSGADQDARRDQPGWDAPGADLSPTAKRRDGTAAGWIDAGIAPPPNLATRLVARAAPPIKVAETFTPVSSSDGRSSACGRGCRPAPRSACRRPSPSRPTAPSTRPR
jgi:alpha-L-rhamnosidase